jgi:hypothetical protein
MGLAKDPFLVKSQIRDYLIDGCSVWQHQYFGSISNT